MLATNEDCMLTRQEVECLISRLSEREKDEIEISAADLCDVYFGGDEWEEALADIVCAALRIDNP